MVESQQNQAVARGKCASEPFIKNQTKNKYTWRQVAERNNEKEAWIIVRDKVYNVTDWLCKHPGGKEMLLLHAGRDSTHSFNSYHPFGDKAAQTLAKYEIGYLDGDRNCPSYLPDSGFYKECQNRVAAYFAKNQLNPKDSRPGIIRMLAVLPIGLTSYFLMNGWFTSNILVLLAFSVLYGFCETIPLLHLVHDASHAAFTKNYKIWEFVGRLTMDWFSGASFTSWNNQHIIGHHIYTNVAGFDPDLPVDFKSDIRRIVDRQILKPIYAWQHFYLPPLYGFLTLKFRLQDFTHTFLSRTNGPVRVNPIHLIDWILLIISKLFWMFYRIWIPMYILHAPMFWATFILAEFVSGWYLAFNFQVSHISTSCEYQCDERDHNNIPVEWAISQIKSSVDYAHGSWFTTFMSGALNYQVTHHLFPSISQYHLPAIAPIVRDVCKEYKIDYIVLPSFFDAFTAHLAYLKLMGSNGKPVSIHMG